MTSANTIDNEMLGVDNVGSTRFLLAAEAGSARQSPPNPDSPRRWSSLDGAENYTPSPNKVN